MLEDILLKMQLTRKQKEKEGIKNLLHCFYNNIASDVYFKKDCYYHAIAILLACKINAFTLQLQCF